MATSEFKFACPICGQHMVCDVSQGGSVMQCPTCFRKIVAPKVPASGGKYILTGSVYVEKTTRANPVRTGSTFGSAVRKSLPFWLFLVILLVLTGVGFHFFGKHIVHLVAGRSWKGMDIGAVSIPGSFSQTDHSFTITGSGADTWNREDSFQYVFKSLNGDGSLTAQVLSLKNTHQWAKAGVMIRGTTNANSAFAMTAIRPDGQAQFIWRKVDDGDAASSPLSGGKGFPKWIKIIRQGDSLRSFWRAKEADAWQPIGDPQTIQIAHSVQIGLVVCAHNTGTLCQAQFTDVLVDAGSGMTDK